MKVALITILDNTNFGTYLQALATGLVLQNLGCEVEVINYVRECMTQKGMSKAILEDRGFFRWLNRRRGIRPAIELREKDIDFLRGFLSVTRKYENYDEIQSTPPVADVYLTGSDQVWNSYYNRGIDRSFFLDFAPKGRKRIAYAASIGMKKIPSEEVDKFVGLLHKYSAISVRERDAKILLKQYHIESTLVLDPTLLLNHEKWGNLVKKYTTLEKEPYLLIYSVENKRENKLINRYATEIARKKNLKIIQVSYSSKSKMINSAEKKYDRATPDVFLSLMYHASFVVVSSFHGTAFSINFNKQFLTIVPERFNSRVESLLSLLGLQTRMVTDEDYTIENMKDINYINVNSKLEKERMASIGFLKSNLLI